MPPLLAFVICIAVVVHCIVPALRKEPLETMAALLIITALWFIEEGWGGFAAR